MLSRPCPSGPGSTPAPPPQTQTQHFTPKAILLKLISENGMEKRNNADEYIGSGLAKIIWTFFHHKLLNFNFNHLHLVRPLHFCANREACCFAKRWFNISVETYIGSAHMNEWMNDFPMANIRVRSVASCHWLRLFHYRKTFSMFRWRTYCRCPLEDKQW